MPTAAKSQPTNEKVVELLNEVLAELQNVKSGQEQLAKELQRVAGRLGA